MQTITWDEVSSKLSADDVGKWDRQVPAARLKMTPHGTLDIEMPNTEGEHFELSDLATSQFCDRLEIPPRYYRRLPGQMRAQVANFDLERLSDKSFLLRGKAAYVRAFLSGAYVAYDNQQIAETVEGLLQTDTIRIKSFVLEETNCFLKLVSEELVDPPSGLKAGIMIGNSEVGMGSVSVEPFVFRKACTNDLVVKDEKAFRHAHIHFTPHELMCRMAEAIGEVFLQASKLLDAFLKAREEPVLDPLAVIRRIAEARSMSQKLADQIVAHFVAEPEPSRFGVINAFTGAAHTLAPLEAIELERFAGTLLTAPL